MASASLASAGPWGGASSYADVATFEAGLHDVAPPVGVSSLFRVASPVSISSPVRVAFDQHIDNEILSTAEEFSALAAIFRF